ncbi:DUF3048 C-terminal domain-containing protein [Spongisporangium articulatum]|uniref:DUF3048 C-terminal domain-containing protein n=1 Tax=Spongisporangium articulatum TaxID=3362603 RepID=A0ABW8AKR1_9ACTN
MNVDRRTALLGALGVTGTALAGCTHDDADIIRSSGAPSPTPSVDARPRWPLTGRLMRTADAGQHAAVAVKVPDNENEHPQAGLDKADIVFVELDGYRDSAGYSGTRLVPLFHSRMPDDVAPVRSMRPVDVPLLSPVGALIGSTGATGWVLNYIKSFAEFVEGPQITYLETKGTGSYGIDPARVRTYQGVTYYDRAVVCHPKVLAKQSRKFRTGPSRAYFPFATTQTEISTETGQPARVVRVPWKQGHTYDMGYTWSEKAGKYLRSMPWGPHTLVDGRRVTTDNIMIVCADQKYAKIYSGRGGPEPIHGIVDASGTFYYAHGGKYVTGTWSKGAVNQPFSFTLADGSPLKMAPGQTYVELPRANAKVLFKA